jgi:hypothetical protein
MMKGTRVCLIQQILLFSNPGTPGCHILKSNQFCVQLGNIFSQIEMIREVYGAKTIGQAAVYKWFRHFMEG